jgi:UDP-N-acetylmuramoylalanine--D-glutamate ligase
MESLAGKKVLVMGLGRFGGGVGVTKWLVSQGAQVTVNDADPAEKLADSIKSLDGLPITFKLGGHFLEDFTAAELLVINPAVNKEKQPVVKQALARGIPYTTEMNLFLERNPAFTIGITGSVGKSTTTTLIHEALQAGVEKSRRVFLGGNIGKSLLMDLPSIRATDLVVLELSSFMLEDTPRIRWSPNVAVVTNVFPNHLDRHETLAQYAATKQNILKFQKPGGVAILNNDHDLVSRWIPLAEKSGAKVMKYTTRGPGALDLVIPGEHNQSNARAAMAVLDALESRGIAIDRPAAMKAITSFPGLTHRLQLVHTLTLPGGRQVRFYNDSKATSPDASITALNAFPPRSAIFLVGGYDKHIDLSAFENLLAARAGAVIGLGQTGEAILANVRKQATADLPPDRVVYAATLENAVPLATTLADHSTLLSSIVLSPASASWDQFPNYEKRGDTFVALARQIRTKLST